MSKFIIHQSIEEYQRDQVKALVKQAIDEETPASLYFLMQMALDELRSHIGPHHDILTKFYREYAHSLSRKEMEWMGKMLAFAEREGCLTEAQRDSVNDLALRHAGRAIL